MPAARRLANAASVQFGRAVLLARQTTAFVRFAILSSPTLRSKAMEIRKALACQFFWVAFTSLPFSAQIPLKRATAWIGRVNILVRRQVHGPSSLNSNLQREVVIHFRTPNGAS